MMRSIFWQTRDMIPKYGARPLRRTIQTQIEDQLSEKILEGIDPERNRGSD